MICFRYQIAPSILDFLGKYKRTLLQEPFAVGSPASWEVTAGVAVTVEFLTNSRVTLIPWDAKRMDFVKLEDAKAMYSESAAQ